MDIVFNFESELSIHFFRKYFTHLVCIVVHKYCDTVHGVLVHSFFKLKMRKIVSLININQPRLDM